VPEKRLKVSELTVVGLASVTAPPVPPLPKTASSPEVHVTLEVPFHHWLAVSHAPKPSVWEAVAAFASQVRVAAEAGEKIDKIAPTVRAWMALISKEYGLMIFGRDNLLLDIPVGE
jgi:hypothetical protein